MQTLHGYLLPLSPFEGAWKFSPSTARKVHGKVLAPLHPQIAPNIASNVGTTLGGAPARELCMEVYSLRHPSKVHGKVLTPLHPQIAHNIASNVGAMVGGVAARELCMEVYSLRHPSKEHGKVLAPLHPPKAPQKLPMVRAPLVAHPQGPLHGKLHPNMHAKVLPCRHR